MNSHYSEWDATKQVLKFNSFEAVEVLKIEERMIVKDSEYELSSAVLRTTGSSTGGHYKAIGKKSLKICSCSLMTHFFSSGERQNVLLRRFRSIGNQEFQWENRRVHTSFSVLFTQRLTQARSRISNC